MNEYVVELMVRTHSRILIANVFELQHEASPELSWEASDNKSTTTRGAVTIPVDTQWIPDLIPSSPDI